MLGCKKHKNVRIKCVYTLGSLSCHYCLFLYSLPITRNPNRNNFHFPFFVLTWFFNLNIYVYKIWMGWVINILWWNRVSKCHIWKAFSWIRFHLKMKNATNLDFILSQIDCNKLITRISIYFSATSSYWMSEQSFVMNFTEGIIRA